MTKNEIMFLIEKIIGKLKLKKLLRPLYYVLEDLTGGSVKKNEILRDMYKNKRCFILENGVSLNEIDVTKLTNEYTFGGNFITYIPHLAEGTLRNITLRQRVYQA